MRNYCNNDGAYLQSSCGCDKVIEIAKKYKLAVIEDSAELIGAEYKGRNAAHLVM